MALPILKTNIRKKILLIILILPSFLLNYFTLTLFDHDNNLSIFSTVLVCSFNIINISFAYIYLKFNFKTLIIFVLYFFFLFLVFDFSLEKILNKNSLHSESLDLGWALNPNVEIKLIQKNLEEDRYEVKFKSSTVVGFREYGKLDSNKKKILLFGDSLTVGPHSSNGKMYYDVIKNELIKNKIDLEWFVMGGGGYSTVQQLLLFKKHFKIIKPEIILHQFCVNDFFDNSYNINKLYTAHDQFYRRPFYRNGDYFKNESYKAKIYRFLFKHSFIFKKIDQIYIFKKFKKYGRLTKDISKKDINESIENTKQMFNEIKNLINSNIIYMSINCANENKFNLDKVWKQIIYNIEGHPIDSPSNYLKLAKKQMPFLFHEDGGHLSEAGNKIYGELISKEILKILDK